MATLFQDKVSSLFVSKVEEISDKLGIDKNWLMFLIYNESAKTFDPTTTNPIFCVGIIQFCSDKGQSTWAFNDRYKTIDGKQYKLSDIKNMSAEQQLDLAYLYYKPFRSKLISFEDLMLVNLWPVAAGKETYTFPQYVVDANPHYFKNVSGDLTGFRKRMKELVYEQVGTEFYDSFFEKKSDSSEPTQTATRSVFRIYQREIIITSGIVLLLIALFFVGKKLIK